MRQNHTLLNIRTRSHPCNNLWFVITNMQPFWSKYSSKWILLYQIEKGPLKEGRNECTFAHLHILRLIMMLQAVTMVTEWRYINFIRGYLACEFHDGLKRSRFSNVFLFDWSDGVTLYSLPGKTNHVLIRKFKGLTKVTSVKLLRCVFEAR